jgi:hypothetical protein
VKREEGEEKRAKTQRGKRKKKNRGKNRKKNREEGTTGEKYYRERGGIGREERFRERKTLSPRRLKPQRNEREEK